MGSLAPALSPLLPDLLPRPPDPPPLPPLAPEHENRRLFAALAHLFLRQATKQAVLLIVEDLHWSDETSLDFLHFLARRCAASPLLVLLTYRSDEVHPSLSHFLAQLDRERLAQEFALAPLTQSEVSTMLSAIFALRRAVFTAHPLVQGDLLDAMYSITEGNPFLIEELLKSLIEAGDMFYEHGHWQRKELGEWHIPRSVQDAVEFFFQAEDGIRSVAVTGVQTCALPISPCRLRARAPWPRCAIHAGREAPGHRSGDCRGGDAFGGRSLAGRESPRSLSERPSHLRSEERRVGKECRSRWSPYH